MPGPKLILLFGLSANPPTGRQGHVGLVAWAASEAQPMIDGRPQRPDEVWVLPVYRHAFPSKREMPAYEHRREMARLAFEALPDARIPVRVRDDERELALARPHERIGTIDLLRALELSHPGVRFALLLGADTYRDLLAGKWKESQALLRRVPVVVAGRGGVEGVDGVAVPGLGPVSSSAARAADREALRGMVSPAVYAYIEAHGLYAFGRGGDD